MTSPSRQQLRLQLRSQRKALSPQQQNKASQELSRTFTKSALFTGVRSIAFYMANDGEIDPIWLMQKALKHNIECYLPVLSPNRKLWFIRYQQADPLYPNGFGIPEPAKWKPTRKSWALDLILMPLVAFDRKGGRLGMGGGFYDRSFSWIRHRPCMRQPKIVGLAHQCQELESLTMESWDIPMSYVVTDKEFIRTDTGKH
ncbi:MAG: 5-formyltetrahydrofolate cyclo-ligase [Spongiibacteraceae bacterium]|nr:5-formyltetrahydrofolate cyclo-ligase [Spongiibacteraceae bacterium]